MAADYFRARALRAEKLPEGQRMRPDFRVESSDGVPFLAEVKELEAGYENTGVEWDTLHRKLETDLRRALKQFRSEDSEHLLPWVLVFVSSGLVNVNTIEDLVFLASGVMYGDSGEVLDRRPDLPGRRAASLFKQVDAHVLLSKNGRDGCIVVTQEPLFRSELRRLIG